MRMDKKAILPIAGATMAAGAAIGTVLNAALRCVRVSHYDTQRTRNAGTAPSGAPPQRKNRRRRIALRDLSVTFAVWSAFWTTK